VHNGTLSGPSPLRSTAAIIRWPENMIHLSVGWALDSSDFDSYPVVPIGIALGPFWPAFDRVGQAGRAFLFCVASNTRRMYVVRMNSPFPPVCDWAGPFPRLKRPAEAPMQKKLGQGM
jgi:hypothetical protein